MRFNSPSQEVSLCEARLCVTPDEHQYSSISDISNLWCYIHVLFGCFVNPRKVGKVSYDEFMVSIMSSDLDKRRLLY